MSTSVSVAPQIAAPRSADAGSASQRVKPSLARQLSDSKILYTFQGVPDAGQPEGGLIAANGTLYGTTDEGGDRGCHFKLGCGTVYEISTSGEEHTLYSFKGVKKKDGSDPQAGLINLNGTLYGTTTIGGGGKCFLYKYTTCGTVFAVSKSGTERVLYRFKGGADGGNPLAGLIAVNGVLYGTTARGGNWGTVFEVTTSGKERVLYRFKGGRDGGYPEAGLVGVDGEKNLLYGTTFNGGSRCSAAAAGCGTVFEVSTSGKEQILYRFKGGTDGANPTAALIAAHGSLYGTTLGGGIYQCGYSSEAGCGTVFEVSTSGHERALYNFQGGTDGEGPVGSLVVVNGMFYGTTSAGGNNVCTRYISSQQVSVGCGTVFSVSTAGHEQVVFRFARPRQANYPNSALTALNGVLYGTTAAGGGGYCSPGYYNGFGTVFRI